MMHVTKPAVEQPERRPNTAFAPMILADDLRDLHRIYTRFFDSMDTTEWDRPARRGSNQWTLHETIAHLCALNGAGLESVTHSLRGESYTFRGLDNRYQFKTYKRKGIDDHLGTAVDALFTEFFRIHDGAADIARNLQAGQSELTVVTPIYNRPARIVEILAFMIMHIGLIHSAQVAEPAGVPPLWTLLPPALRHRMVERAMRAMSLLYRHDIGGSLRAVLAFRVDGPGGGQWYVDLSPEAVTSGEGVSKSPALVLRFHETDDFCRMLTKRMSLPLALITGKLKLRGDLRLFMRMSKLFSEDARP